MADYSTLDLIVTRLGNQVTAADRPAIEQRITEASAAIDRWCGQSFDPASSATVRTFTPYTAVDTRIDPFHTTTDLVIATDAADDGTWSTTWTAADYALDRFGGNMADLYGAPYDRVIAVGGLLFPTRNRRPRPLKVTAKWGWSAVPALVAGACEIITVDLFKRKEVAFGIQTAGLADFAGLRIGVDVMRQVSSLLSDLRRMDRVAGIA